MPVSAPVSSSTGRTVRLASSVRRAMSSASSSIETPAFTRRTFAWLSTSLSKGMSREALSVILRVDVFIGLLRDGRPGASLPAFQPVTKTRPASSSEAAGRAGRRGVCPGVGD